LRQHATQVLWEKFRDQRVGARVDVGGGRRHDRWSGRTSQERTATARDQSGRLNSTDGV
jgi:hypothetical protein